MKCELFLLLVLSTIILSSDLRPRRQNRRMSLEGKNGLRGFVNQRTATGSKWYNTAIGYKGMQLKVVHHVKIDPRRISKLISMIDGSMQSRTPAALAGGGFIQGDDIICVSNKMLYWFSVSAKGRRHVRSGGGLLAGMWEIKIKPNSDLILKRINPQGYVKNLLYPGSTPGKGFFGADIYGGYIGSNVIWGLEHSIDVRMTEKFGRDILSIEKGAFASDDGVFIEFQGIVGNSRTDRGIESITDTDPRPGVIGETMYTLTYRVPAYRNDIIQEVTFKALKNNFGPINTAKLALYLPGYDQNNMVYAANTELMKGGPINLNDVAINKYFKNSCEKKVYFYNVSYANTKTKAYATTADGRGTLACIGSPKNRVPFVCGYPNNDFIPKVSYEEYTIELYDNQSISRYGRFHGINYKLLKSPNKSFTLTPTSSKLLILIMRYKVIPAFIKMNSKKRQ